METRKVQRTGHSTFTVSLPKDWIKKGGISKGERMQLSLNEDGSIVLNVPGRIRNPRVFTITGSDEYGALFRKVLGLYLAGFHTIIFKLDKDEGTRLKSDLRRILSKITGLEVTEETSTEIIIKDLFDSSRYTPSMAMERMHSLSRSVVKHALKDMEGGSDSLEDIEACRRDVQWLFWLVTRQYNLVLYDSSYSTMLGINQADGANYVTVCKALVRITDHSFLISRTVNGSGPIIKSQAQTRILEQLDMAVESFRNKDRSKAMETIHASRELRWVNPETVMTGDILTKATIADSINRIITHVDEIAETAYYATFMT